LFIGHPEAGERSAVIYALLGSCRRHGISPSDYLKDLFARLPAAKITQIKEFTPAAWAKAKGKIAVLPIELDYLLFTTWQLWSNVLPVQCQTKTTS
jgi:hypothetical protein